MYLIDVGMNCQEKRIELIFLTNSSVICFSCARSSMERQLAVEDKDKIKTVTCRKRIKADDVGMRAIVFSIYSTCVKVSKCCSALQFRQEKRSAFYREIDNHFVCLNINSS